ncbi:DUF4917 family protein [Nisaea sediminum]|uniref:DUF4917 family protein n=1 Tax=Nisaea sediminum TaxID=2775867 RepID=UPI001865C94C|nr:DUF4917 family protein [Nisaea sediminum]
MTTPSIISFVEAMAAGTGKKHLLLGNGFSIALKPDIFSYNALFEDANFDDAPHLREVFDLLQTRDFETVIKALLDTSKVLPAYEGLPPELVDALAKDAEAIKTILVDAIAGRHPDRPYDIEDEQYANCRAFLNQFAENNGHIYTLNYDVLLYWTMMHDDEEMDDLGYMCDDGFRAPDDDDGDDFAEYVTWQESQKATVHFLHGALHLFDAGHELQKYTWSRTDRPIIDQVRAALDANRYPLFVSEGDSTSKLTKITHSAYLHKGLRSLESVYGSLYIYGHSLADNDTHIWRVIEDGKIARLFVSIYGDPNTPENQQVIARAQQMNTNRQTRTRGRKSLDVVFFDAESAQIWG